MANKNCFCCDINLCPCMSPKKGVISAAITLAVLKVISIIVVCVFVVELDQYTKDEMAKHSGGSVVSTEPSVEERYAPVRTQYVIFLVLAGLGIGFDMSLLIGALLKNTWVSIRWTWTIGTVACWTVYFILYGFEFWSLAKKQHMFTSYTEGMSIWKQYVEYAIFLYSSFVAETFGRRLLEEKQQQTLEASRVAQVQAEAPAQDQPGDQSINAENQIMNP